MSINELKFNHTSYDITSRHAYDTRKNLPKVGEKASPNVIYDKKSYQLSEVMRIHEKGFHEIPTPQESEYYWTARKSDPSLDQQLYDMDKAKVLKEVDEIQKLLLKASRGEQLTEKEKAMLEKDPILAVEFESRKRKTVLK